MVGMDRCGIFREEIVVVFTRLRREGHSQESTTHSKSLNLERRGYHSHFGAFGYFLSFHGFPERKGADGRCP